MADKPPRFASESLIERMGMADLGRNRRPATCTEGTNGAVAFAPTLVAINVSLSLFLLHQGLDAAS